MRRALAALALLAVAGSGGCAGPRVRLPSAQPTTEPAWRSMQAEHRVNVEFATTEGKIERKALRGAIAIERPGKLRLAALGPGGIRLFDLLLANGQVTVLYTFRAIEGSAFGAAIQSMAGDLGAAYLLEPASPERAIEKDRDGESVTIKEPGRTVHLRRFVSARGLAVPTLIEAKTDKYQFVVDVVSVDVDQTLDPRLFSP